VTTKIINKNELIREGHWWGHPDHVSILTPLPPKKTNDKMFFSLEKYHGPSSTTNDNILTKIFVAETFVAETFVLPTF